MFRLYSKGCQQSMKHLQKIILLFMVIFITGITIAVKQINAPLNTPQESLEIHKDSLKLNKLTKSSV